MNKFFLNNSKNFLYNISIKKKILNIIILDLSLKYSNK